MAIVSSTLGRAPREARFDCVGNDFGRTDGVEYGYVIAGSGANGEPMGTKAKGTGPRQGCDPGW